ncbi:MAG: HD domain-containing protein [Patescibacteria group bacterium]|nr:HD domain-containing protein [Patescibacteria group bacterium]
MKGIKKQDSQLLDAAKKVARAVRSLTPVSGYKDTVPRAFIVGGFVRDALLNMESKDVDVEVYGLSAEALENLLKDLYPGHLNVVGRAFGVLKVDLGNGQDMDVALPRRESKAGPGHKGFKIQGDPCLGVKEAMRRRDFTINAMAIDPLTGELTDPFNGAKDLKDKTLCVVDASTFVDDPLRIYRALQLTARFKLSVEKKTMELMRFMIKRGDLSELSKERVTDELKKLLLKSEKPSVGFELARELGIIKKYYPELQALIGTEQEKEWHAEGDVWMHTMMVVDAGEKIIHNPKHSFSEQEKLQIMLGCVCHDLGKPPTTKVIDGRIRSLGHSDVGLDITKELLSRLSFSGAVEQAVLIVVKYHLALNMIFRNKERGQLNNDQYVNAVRKIIKRIHPTSWHVLLAVAEADSRGRVFPGAQSELFATGELFERTVLENRLDKEPTRPLVQGRDLMKLGVKPGARMGELIRSIESLRDKGKIKTRVEALKYLEKLLKNLGT